MIVYSNKFKISHIPYKDYEFVVLNELKDLSSRSDDNCLYHTKFLFEIDSLPREFQYEVYVPVFKPLCRTITYSGNKSYHFIMEFRPEYESICAKYYREIWSFINDYYFDGKADTQCKNPSRLTRRPGAYRKDKNAWQNLVSSSDFYISDGIKFMQKLKSYLRDCQYFGAIEETKRFESRSKNSAISAKSNDGLCKNYDVITYYMGKSFPNKTGNGDSSSSLFKAVRCCLKYNDRQTLLEVLTKARRESWSEKEIDHIITSIERKYL